MQGKILEGWKKMTFRTSCAVFCSALLLAVTGCTHLRPELQRHPTEAQLKKLPAGRYTGPIMAELPNYIEFTGQLAQWYQERADQLRETLAVASETTFFGAVFGVLGAAFGNADVAKGAAGVVGGTTLLSSRYQLSIQASNYERASTAMLCMRDRLADAQAFVARTGTDSTLKAVDPDVHARLPQHVRDQVLVVQNKLDKVQRDIVIAEPDVDKIKAALGLQNTVKGAMHATDEPQPDPINTLLANLSACSAAF